MSCCTPTCKKWTIFTVAALCLVLGIVLAVCWTSLLNTILNHELSLGSENTFAYEKWKKTPIPMYIDFYLFDWVNHENVTKNNKVKPEFVERGPYTFSEVHVKENVTFNNNNTLTFLNNRWWHFRPDKSNGTLQDEITSINTIAATVAYLVRDKHKIVKRGVNFFMEEKRVNLTVTKTAGEFLFDGYDDPLLDLVHQLNVTVVNITFTKFGWFVERNGTSTYDGIFTMHDGVDDIEKLGLLTAWNYAPRTQVYEGTCGMVNGTTGEQWYPIKKDQTASVFSSDVCSTILLNRTGSVSKHGVDGYKFSAGEYVFDNGTKYPDMKCFVSGKFDDIHGLPSGVRNVSLCKFGAPAFVSFPHFYLADPFYRDAIVGMKPSKDKHEFFLSLEPNTGVPLEVSAAVQINILALNMPEISIFKDINTTFLPTLWFRQSAELTEDLAGQVKMILTLPAVGSYTGYGVIGIGCLIGLVGLFITFRQGWKGTDHHQLLSEQSF